MENERRIVVASDSGISIHTSGDISDALGACLGTRGLILTERDLAPEFFDLRTGLAGELFQKFIHYKLRVAIVLPNPEAYGELVEVGPCGSIRRAGESVESDAIQKGPFWLSPLERCARTSQNKLFDD